MNSLLEMSGPPALCHFGDGWLAVVRYTFDYGCACFPEDNIQNLCAQHASSTEPRGSIIDAHYFDPTWPDGWSTGG